jgi:hypothetical protein
VTNFFNFLLEMWQYFWKFSKRFPWSCCLGLLFSPMLAFCNWVTNNPPQFMLLVHCKKKKLPIWFKILNIRQSETKIYYNFNLMLTCMEYDNPFYWSSIIINNQICIFFHHVRIQKPL